MIGLTMRSVTWNRFPIKNLWLIPCFFHLWSEVTWSTNCFSISSYGAKRKWNIFLRPIKNLANWLLTVWVWKLVPSFQPKTLRWFNPGLLIINSMKGQNLCFTSDVDVCSRNAYEPHFSNISCLLACFEVSITYLVQIIFVITDVLLRARMTL